MAALKRAAPVAYIFGPNARAAQGNHLQDQASAPPYHLGREMTEIEQLRKELNELRERLAQVEARTVPLMTFGQPPQITPKYEVRVSCGDASREQAINQGRAIQRGMQAELGRRSRNT